MNAIERKRVVNSCSASDERATVRPLARVCVCVSVRQSLLCSFNQQRINIIESENDLVSISRPGTHVDSYFIRIYYVIWHILRMYWRWMRDGSCKTGNVYLLSISAGHYCYYLYFIFNDCGFSAGLKSLPRKWQFYTVWTKQRKLFFFLVFVF